MCVVMHARVYGRTGARTCGNTEKGREERERARAREKERETERQREKETERKRDARATPHAPRTHTRRPLTRACAVVCGQDTAGVG